MGNSKKLAKLAVAGKVVSALAIIDGQATDDVKPLESPVDKPLPILPVDQPLHVLPGNKILFLHL